MSDGVEIPARDRKHVRMSWTGEGQEFRGGPVGGFQGYIDGGGKRGAGPMDSLLMALAGCMAIDVVDILQKSRVPVHQLSLDAHAIRRSDAPRRFLSIRLIYTVDGPTPDDDAKLQRAVDLSRDKYCSVLHSLRQDIDVDIAIHRS